LEGISWNWKKVTDSRRFCILDRNGLQKGVGVTAHIFRSPCARHREVIDTSRVDFIIAKSNCGRTATLIGGSCKCLGFLFGGNLRSALQNREWVPGV
jgi:hypothetical protein